MTEEYFDVLDEQGNKTGRTKPRSAVHRDGDWHRAVNIFIITPQNEVLLQRRSLTKDSYPGKLDISCGGHLSAGDDIETAAIRELEEELGMQISPQDLIHLATFRSSTRPAPDFINNSFNEMFVVFRDLDPTKLKLQAEEVAEVILVPLSKFSDMVNRHDPDLVLHDRMYAKLSEFLAKDQRSKIKDCILSSGLSD